ncbi:MAG: 5/3-nucleotidase SurE [Pseudomonadota bacterium]|jgi:5'-nucleotidase
MAERDLSRARILLSNDDGIGAEGLAVLESIARTLSDDVWVVAPETEQSGASHSLTMTRPLRLKQHGEKRFSVDGTPTDCVLLAINHLMAERRPDLVLSGINHGNNIGEDVTYSGTIAAAMEATLLGVPAIALSQRMDHGTAPRWDTARHFGAEVIRKALAIDWPRHVLVNVNFPDADPAAVTGIQVVRHGNRKIGDELVERIDPRNRPYFWIGPARGEEHVPEDTDIHVVTHGGISVTPIYLDLTHYACLEAMRKAFAA